MSRPLSARAVRRTLSALAVVAVGLTGVGTVPAAAADPANPSAVGDTVIAFVEVEDGVISGGPALNSGDHGNFSGTGSYTFRETGMTSTMTVTAPEAGTYPVYIRYAAGLLGADENVTRSMGLTTNGSRQVVSYPMTGDWETWRVAQAQVNLNAGSNTLAINCNRGTDFCRLNFDAVQVGGTSFDTCAPTPVNPGWTRLFDGTFASFDVWRKAGGSGVFGRQADCTLRSFRGTATMWTTTTQTGPHTVEADWKRSSAGESATLHLASAGRDTAASIAVPLGTGNAVGRPVGEWNTTRVEVTASAVRIYLNGALIETRAAPSTLNGAIGITNAASTEGMRFRDVQVLDDYELGPIAGPVTRARLADDTVSVGGESRLANLVAEAQRATSTSNGANGAAQISFVHPDAVKADLAGPTVATYKQAAAVQPSTADMRNFKLTGAQVKSLLEQQWSPSQPFVRLGTSAGFRYTYDPTRPQDSRVTDVRLNGVPVAAGTSYSVTTSGALRSDARFPAFSGRTLDRAANKTERAALVEHLGTAPTVDDTQHSVGVSTPHGTTVVAGEVLAVDLTSLAFPGAASATDSSLSVTLDGQPLGGPVPVDRTSGQAPTDEYGTAAVRALVPATTPAGPATLVVSGATTGSVTVPITVTAPAVVAVDSTTTVSVAAGSLPVRQGTSSVSISVARPGGTPTGQVELWVGGAKVSTVALVAGRASAKVGPFPTVGNRTVQARYLGDAATNPSSSAVATVAVVKAAPSLAVAVQPGKVVAGRTRAKVVVAVRAAGFTPTGKVTVKIGAKTYAGTLKAGKVTIALPKFRKAGTVRAAVTYAGDALTVSRQTTKKIVVRKAPRR
ncbi:5'-nucleotidase C-terminal domain-containing protein [Nocardioides dongxiaopingii]|uniref:5'-nucleotidase C-terminal domain-containing protein n=1 Tax=Nocardioides dongxiaopingii TaxID=2576036 RepID=UPI00148536AF|nr:5'-nucleotidase C-terminal domain-containing protein [Nocardioides dongxiaopingii]